MIKHTTITSFFKIRYLFTILFFCNLFLSISSLDAQTGCASLCHTVASYNNTDCTLKVWCDEISCSALIYDMGTVEPGQVLAISPSALHARVYMTKPDGTEVASLYTYENVGCLAYTLQSPVGTCNASSCDPPTLSTSFVNSDCNQNNGSISVNGSGGSGGNISYYRLNNEAWTISFFGNKTWNNVSPGIYTVYVTYDTSDPNCWSSSQVFVGENNNCCPTTIPAQYMSVNNQTFQQTNTVTVCSGSSVLMDFLGEFPGWNFSYTRPDGNTFPGGTNGVNNDQILVDAIAPNNGTWTVNFTDPQGCPGSANFTINSQSLGALTQFISVNNQAFQQTNTVTVCPDTPVILDFGGEFPGWDFYFTRPDGATFPGGTNGVNNDQIAIGSQPAGAGTWVVTYTNPEGCSGTSNFIVNINSLLTDAGTITGGATFCSTGNSGVITGTAATGGNAGAIQYRWQMQQRAACASSWGAWTTVANATGGNYNPLVSDVDQRFRRQAKRTNCGSWLNSNTVLIDIDNPLTDAGTIDGGAESCEPFNPPTITGGTPPSGGCGGSIIYKWQFRNGTAGSWNDIPNTATATYNPDYVLTQTRQFRRMTKREDCGNWTATNPVTMTINTPTQLTCESRINNAMGWTAGQCTIAVYENDKLQLSALPNNLTNYQWTGPAGFNQAGDALGDVLVANNIAANQTGQYIVTAQDENGCPVSITITVVMLGSPEVTVISTDEICTDAGGALSFSFSDNPAQTFIQFSIDGGSSFPYQVADAAGTFIIEDLATGTYDIQTQWGDGTGLVILPSQTIGTEPSLQVDNVSVENAICGAETGSITFTFSDNPTVTAIQFSLDGGSTYQSSIPDNSGSVTYSNLTAGVYNLAIRRGDGQCPTDLPSVTVAEQPPVLLNALNCIEGNQDDTFTADLTAYSPNLDGTGMYTIEYNGVVLNNAGTLYSESVIVTNSNFIADGSTNYEFIIRDVANNSCQQILSFTAPVSCSSVSSCSFYGYLGEYNCCKTCRSGNLEVRTANWKTEYKELVSENVALNKPNVFNDTPNNGTGHTNISPTDGDLTGANSPFNYIFSNSRAGNNNRWDVDLIGFYDIESINIYTPEDCCGGDASNYRVFISHDPFETNDLNELLSQNSIENYSVPISAGTTPSIISGLNINGRYVRIYLEGNGQMKLTEVVIIGSGNENSSPYNYTWSDLSIGNIDTVDCLAPGFYQVTITDVSTGCSVTKEYEVSP